MKDNKKYIFVIGGVISGLGKGICAASIGALLKACGYKIFLKKLDPYLNIDPGTMNPTEHGEVFVTQDGAETDLDLGHYERFVDVNLTQKSNVTAGKIYKQVIEKERQGTYNGSTIQIIPHITNEIKKAIVSVDQAVEIVIIEIGGTVGDIESLPFIESVRQLSFELGKENVLIIHTAWLVYLNATKEIKTKPIQHSVRKLLESGLAADMIVARTSRSNVPAKIKHKISLFCNVTEDHVFVLSDADSIYEVPLLLNKQNIISPILEHFKLPDKKPDMVLWNNFNHSRQNTKHELKIAIVGKYVQLNDAYLSLIEALYAAGIKQATNIKIDWIASQDLTEANYESRLASADAILVPGGFGHRGQLGKILAITYARTHKVPFLGLCLGMQTAVIEYARNVLKYQDADSTEFKTTAHPFVHIITGTSKDAPRGGTLRLGNYENELVPNSLAHKCYQKLIITERHRHRYEINNAYVAELEKHGMLCSGFYKKANLVEIIEIPTHPFFLATQFHPEFTSRPHQAHPLFLAFVKAALLKKS